MARKAIPGGEGTTIEPQADVDGPAGSEPMAAPTVGTLVDFDGDGHPLVDFPANPFLRALAARSCVDLGDGEIGAEVVLWFQDGDVSRPLVMGCIRPVRRAAPPPAADVEINLSSIVDSLSREDVRIGAMQTLTLRCGRATITLTREGQVLINGTYVETRASGTNRVQGGSVRIN